MNECYSVFFENLNFLFLKPKFLEMQYFFPVCSSYKINGCYYNHKGIRGMNSTVVTLQCKYLCNHLFWNFNISLQTYNSSKRSPTNNTIRKKT